MYVSLQLLLGNTPGDGIETINEKYNAVTASLFPITEAIFAAILQLFLFGNSLLVLAASAYLGVRREGRPWSLPASRRRGGRPGSGGLAGSGGRAAGAAGAVGA